MVSFKNNFLWQSRITKHPFHLVDKRPWPLLTAAGTFFIVVGISGWIHNFDNILPLFGFGIVLLSARQWWRDVSREATFQGKHTESVESGLRVGIALFIIREVSFFLSLFWSYFHAALNPSPEIAYWPPAGVYGPKPFEVPLLNTTLLLASGFTITCAHHAIIQSDWIEAHGSFAATTILGSLFILVQGLEYKYRAISMADSVYGRTFYLATGFHGVHVIFGNLFIFVMWWRHTKSHFSGCRHFGFEASAWYWHFVDVVWLFLFLSIYWWGY